MFLVIVGLLSTSYALSQSKVLGKVKEGDADLPLVSVVVFRDSMFVKSVTTDSLGNFIVENLQQGHYQLTASMIGYNVHKSYFTINSGQENVTINDIHLQENSYALDEVVIQSQRALVDQKADRMVINLSGSMTTSGNSVLEVLQKSPGVVINKQLSTIALNGRSGVRIMINEKIVQVSPDIILQMLEGMSAANVDKIELITTPPANYDANGSGGIIHIITRKETEYGTSGSMAFTLGAHWAETLGASANINHRSKTAAYFADYSIIRNHNLHVMDMYRQTFGGDAGQSVVDHSRRENKTIQQNLSAGAEWNLSEHTSLNILISGYRRNWRLNAIAYNTMVGSDSVSETTMAVRESNIWQSGTGSIGVQHTIDEKRKIDFTVDYLFYDNNNPSDYTGNQKDDPNISLSKSTPIHFLIATTNYKTSKSSSFSWDIGVKAVVSSLNNNVSVKRVQFDEWVDDPRFTSNSTLHEQVFAGYVSSQWVPNQKWAINSGLRYEYTHTLISSAPNQNLLKRRYGYLFPTISVAKKLVNEAEFYFSYTRRVTRPTYNDIAPYVFFWSANSFSAGNTSLYPSLSDAVTAGYQHKQWSLSLQYANTQNEITPMQPEIDQTSNSLVFRSQNLKYLRTLALTSSYSIPIASWWEVQATVVGQYQTAMTFHLSANEHFKLFGVNVTMNHVISLPKDFAIEVSGMYQSRSLSGISNFLPFGSLNAGVQKKFKRGVLRLSVDDILYTNLWRIRTVSKENNIDVYFRYDWHNQFARATYTWNLGNGKLRALKLKSGSEEERKRVGG